MMSTLQELQVESFDRFLTAANPSLGALSLLEEGELPVLASILLSPERNSLVEFFQKRAPLRPAVRRETMGIYHLGMVR